MGTGHSIVSCFIFDHNGDLLLLKRHRDDWGGGLWATPAGSIEPGEVPELAVRREVEEETGLILDAVEFLGTHDITMPHGFAQMRSFKATVHQPRPIVLRADEHEDWRWFPLATLLEQPDIIWGTPSVLRDFGLIPSFEIDPTLIDGSSATRLD